MDDFSAPHTVTVSPLTQVSVSGGVMVGNPVKGLGVQVQGDVQERTPGKMAREFGAEFEYDNAAVFYCSLSDVASLPPGAIVTLGSRTYWVTGKAREDAAGDELDGAVVPMQRMEFPR